MNEILIAIDNKEIFEMLLKYKEYKIFNQDIIYKEGVIEVLEKNKEIKTLIINCNIFGDITIEKFFLKLKGIKNDLKVYVYIDKKDERYINFLNINGIYNIYNLNNMNFSNILEILNSEYFEKNKINEEIYYLKEVINKQTFKSTTSAKSKAKNVKVNIIIFTGENGCGKTTLSTILSQFVDNLNQKVLLINFGNRKEDTEIMLKTHIKSNEILNVTKNLDVLYALEEKNIFFEKLKNSYRYIVIDLTNKIDFKLVRYTFINANKIFFIIEPTILGINKASILLERFLKAKEEFLVDKIEIIFNRFDRYSIKKSILKEVFKEYEIRGFCKNGKVKSFIKRKIIKEKREKFGI